MTKLILILVAGLIVRAAYKRATKKSKTNQNQTASFK